WMTKARRRPHGCSGSRRAQSRAARHAGSRNCARPGCSTSKEDAVTDEQQVRSLLTLAAEIPDHVQAPVDSLVGRARGEGWVRAASSVLAVAVLPASALALPPIIHSLSGGSPGPTGVRGHGKGSPTATQLTHFRWSSLPPSPLGPRSRPLVVST